MKHKIIFVSLFLFIVMSWVFYPFIISSEVLNNYFPKHGWQSRGVVGDSFGALNTLFSGLALAGLALNIYIQQNQLKKLEEKEDKNSNDIALQASTLKMTALLHYYNSEADRITGLMLGSKGKVNAETEELLAAKLDNLNSERDKIVKALGGNSYIEL